MQQPIINKEILRAIIENCDFNINIDKNNTITFIGIRGAKIKGNRTGPEIEFVFVKPDFNQYGCTILQYRSNGIFVAYDATTLPGVYWVNNPMDSKGAARLLPGKHSFIRGLHKGKPAFIQNGLFPVLRDSDQDLGFDWNDDYLDIGNFGIDLHAGGSATIGKWSAGCQIIKTDKGYSDVWSSPTWKEFYAYATEVPNTIYNYILIPNTHLMTISTIPDLKVDITSTTRLQWGSTGDRVLKVQNKLKELKYNVGMLDGNFGPATLKAVISFQLRNMGAAKTTGMVGLSTWEKMKEIGGN